MNKTVCISKTQLLNLLDVLNTAQSKDSSVSDFIEIELIQENEAQLQSDKCRFFARSIYSECNNHFLGTN